MEKLLRLPELVKDDTGYSYDEKHIGKVFLHGDAYIYFKKSSYETLPKDLIDKVLEFKLKDINSTSINEEALESINSRIENMFSELSDKSSIDDVVNSVENLKKNLFKYIDQKVEKGSDNTITEQYVDQKISEELEIVHNNMTIAVKELVEKYIPKIKPLEAIPGKLTIATLMMLKEAGYSASEISELKREGLI